MDIPSEGEQIGNGTDTERTGTVKNGAPLGICGCGMVKMTRGIEKFCPNCDVHAEAPSNLVSRTSDPGKEAFKPVKRISLVDGSEYIEMVPDEEHFKKLAEQQGTQTVEQQEQPTVARPQTSQPTGQVTMAETPTSMITRLADHYKAQPISDLQQAKKLMKLRGDIDKLRDKILAYENQGAKS
jgi:hypothetical protein